jgi:GNAT superfamily N-acetyltransferase
VSPGFTPSRIEPAPNTRSRLRSDWKGLGLGYLLMTKLIAVARQWRIGELVGQVLWESRRMLAMCRELGFSVRSDATIAQGADGGVMRDPDCAPERC